MTYTLGIPDANQSPTAQQGPLQTNTNLVDQYFGVDHVRYTAATDQGEHLKVTLNDVQPDPVIVAPKCQVYSKAVSGPTDQQLFFANQAGVQQISGNAVLPIKAWGYFTVNVTAPYTVIGLQGPSFNVATVVTSQPANPPPGNAASGEFYLVTMSSALPSANYVVIATATATTPITSAQGYDVVYEPISTTQFKLSYRDQAGGSRPSRLSGISFLVIGG